MTAQTAIFQPPDVAVDARRFGIQDSAIAEMRELYMPLTIAGIDDKEGAEKVHAADIAPRPQRFNRPKRHVSRQLSVADSSELSLALLPPCAPKVAPVR